jgi:hypothetical protein
VGEDEAGLALQLELALALVRVRGLVPVLVLGESSRRHWETGRDEGEPRELGVVEAKEAVEKVEIVDSRDEQMDGECWR